MTKYCKKCHKVFADRFSYCCFCGDKLELYDGKWRDDTNITHEDIIQISKHRLEYLTEQSSLQTGISTIGIGIAYLAIVVTIFSMSSLNFSLFIVMIVTLFGAIFFILYALYFYATQKKRYEKFLVKQKKKDD